MFLQLLYSESAFSQTVSAYEDHFDTAIYPNAPNPDYAASGTLTITSTGTLIVRNLTLTNTSDLVIESGGVLLIQGDLITANQMTIETGGVLIVLGDFIHTGSDKNQGSFTTTGGGYSGVYILGTIDDDGDKQDVANNGSYPVLDCDPPTDPPNDGLTDYIDGCNYGKLPDLIDNPIYQSICGQGVSGGTISNESEDCYESVVLGNLEEADLYFRGYSWYYTDNSNLISGGQPITIYKWNLISGETGSTCVYTGDISETTHFVRQGYKNQGCAVYSNIIDVDPSAGNASVGGSVSGTPTVCSGENVSLTLADNVGSVVRWEKSDDDWGTVIPITATSNTIEVLYLNNTTKFRAVIQSGICSPALSEELTVVVTPTPIGIFSE
ncbi:MAG: hypothetical protein ACERIH_12015 [Labilibaculum antarcticum]